MISNDILDEFITYLFDTIPFKQQINSTNRDGFKNIVKNLLEDLYQNIPEDSLNFLEMNASNKFLDLLYREAGINDYHINRVPESLKIRISYLLNTLNLNKATQKVFQLFHEALEEFYPKLNIYLIEIQPKDINAEQIELEYKLNPRYITDPDSLIEDISESELSGAFLMRPEQFIDRTEKFSNIYTDYVSKARTINIFPIKTGIMYIQNPSGIGQADYDSYIPLMQTIGASLEQYKLFPWKTNQDEIKKLIPFIDYIKLCTYLKFKEFEYKAITLRNTTWRWETRPLETYRDESKLIEWNNALFQAAENGVHWSLYYDLVQTKLNDFLLNDEDLAEAERLETVYKGLKRSGRYNSRNISNQFKTDWNTLRLKARNVSLRKITNIDEFREELIGTEPINLLEFELLILKKFKKVVHGDTRDAINKIKKLYVTNPDNTVDPVNGLVTLVKKFENTTEFNDFIGSTYGNYSDAEPNETKFLLDLLDYYITLGTTPLLKNYKALKVLKFPELLDIGPTDDKYLNPIIYQKVYNELMNNTNIINFTELNDIIKIKYRKIIQQIDEMVTNPDTDVEDFTMIFLYLWKLIQSELSNDLRVRYFWNEFFMRLIMGSTFKDFIYDPIMDLFLEYWFPAELTTQNKDIQTILIKDKMNAIPLDSTWINSLDKTIGDTLVFGDQNKITIYNMDKSIKEEIVNIYKEIQPRELKITIGG